MSDSLTFEKNVLILGNFHSILYKYDNDVYKVLWKLIIDGEINGKHALLVSSVLR